MKIYDVAIVGAGAAGLFAAVNLAERGKKVILYDKNKYPGRKLRITGKGRCNITNYSDSDNIIKNTVRNSKFMYSSLNNFTSTDIIQFFNKNGVKTKVERGNRVFPQSDDAMDIIELFKRLIKELQIDFYNECEVIKVEKENNLFKINTKSGADFSKNLILATGGMSYKVTGSSGDGYKFLKDFNHTITRLKPSLVAMNTKLSKYEKQELMGLSLRNVDIKVLNEKGKTTFSEFGEMLFTHFGISGPIVLSASSYMELDRHYRIILDFKPALSEEQLDNKLLMLFKDEHLKAIGKVLEHILPKKIIPAFLNSAGIEYYEKACNIIKEQRLNIIKNLKGFDLMYDSLRDINEAIITSGGVNVKEVDPKTMQSKLVDGLYIIGELLDVDALTGGYNLQLAFSSAYQAACSIK